MWFAEVGEQSVEAMLEMTFFTLLDQVRLAIVLFDSFMFPVRWVSVCAFYTHFISSNVHRLLSEPMFQL